jgi:hypothetical protein
VCYTSWGEAPLFPVMLPYSARIEQYYTSVQKEFSAGRDLESSLRLEGGSAGCSRLLGCRERDVCRSSGPRAEDSGSSPVPLLKQPSRAFSYSSLPKSLPGLSSMSGQRQVTPSRTKSPKLPKDSLHNGQSCAESSTAGSTETTMGPRS